LLKNVEKRCSITFKKVRGEIETVGRNVCDEWKGSFKNILKYYCLKSTFIADELGLYFKCLPSKTFSLKMKNVMLVNTAKKG